MEFEWTNSAPSPLSLMKYESYESEAWQSGIDGFLKYIINYQVCMSNQVHLSI